MLVACSENRAKLTPDFTVSEIFEGPKGSAVPVRVGCNRQSSCSIYTGTTYTAKQITAMQRTVSWPSQISVALMSGVVVNQAALICA